MGLYGLESLLHYDIRLDVSQDDSCLSLIIQRPSPGLFMRWQNCSQHEERASPKTEVLFRPPLTLMFNVLCLRQVTRLKPDLRSEETDSRLMEGASKPYYKRTGIGGIFGHFAIHNTIIKNVLILRGAWVA